jgi:hypothetical protein
MSLLFAYRFHPAVGPVWSLGGRTGRPRPVVAVAVLGPAGSWTGTALLDTGSDDSVFPDDVATLIGLDLTNAPTGSASGVGMVSAPIRYAEVRLRLSDGNEFREWPARVGFTPTPIKRGLLGFAGFFQFFTATFDGDREHVELTVNATYPGT